MLSSPRCSIVIFFNPGFPYRHDHQEPDRGWGAALKSFQKSEGAHQYWEEILPRPKQAKIFAATGAYELNTRRARGFKKSMIFICKETPRQIVFRIIMCCIVLSKIPYLTLHENRALPLSIFSVRTQLVGSRSSSSAQNCSELK